MIFFPSPHTFILLVKWLQALELYKRLISRFVKIWKERYKWNRVRGEEIQKQKYEVEKTKKKKVTRKHIEKV